MKYIDADKIRAEIERRKKYHLEQFNKKKPDGRPNDGWAESLAIMGELEEFLSFLDTLESNEPTLTWGDVQLLDTFILELAREEREGKDWGESEEFYTEVLRRYNDFVKRTIPEIVGKIHEYNENGRKDSPEN